MLTSRCERRTHIAIAQTDPQSRDMHTELSKKLVTGQMTQCEQSVHRLTTEMMNVIVLSDDAERIDAIDRRIQLYRFAWGLYWASIETGLRTLDYRADMYVEQALVLDMHARKAPASQMIEFRTALV